MTPDVMGSAEKSVPRGKGAGLVLRQELRVREQTDPSLLEANEPVPRCEGLQLASPSRRSCCYKENGLVRQMFQSCIMQRLIRGRAKA